MGERDDTYHEHMHLLFGQAGRLGTLKVSSWREGLSWRMEKTTKSAGFTWLASLL